MVEELKASKGDSLLIPMICSIVQTLLVIPLGILGDRLNRKVLLSWMVAFWAAAELALGLSQNFTHAFIGVAIIGIPVAAVNAVGYAYMLDLIPAERTAEYVGIGVISMAAAQIFGPLIGGKLIDVFGYRYIFPASTVFIIITLVIIRSVGPRLVTVDTGEVQISE